MVKPRVTWIVPINTLVGTGVETCARLRLAYDTPDTCTTVETCGTPVGEFWYYSGDSAPDYGIICKINRCK